MSLTPGPSIPLKVTSLFNVDSTLGAALVGFGFSCAVFGILCGQVWTYFQKYPMDKDIYKALVALLWLAETVDQAFIGHAVYFYTVTNFSQPLVLLTGNIPWTLVAQVLIGVSVGTVVKACFAMRVWRFSNRNIPVTGLIVLLTFGQFGLGIAYSVRAYQLNKLVLASRLKILASLSLGIGCLTDVVIAIALAYFLRKYRTGYRGSDTLVNKLTIYAVNTGALTSAVSLATLILYDIDPESLEFIAVYFVLSKFYAVSFLCTLNTRKTIRGRGTDRERTTGNSQTLGNNTFLMHSRTLPQTKSQLEIGIHQSVSVMSDTGISTAEMYPPPTRWS
ncbi:hypothetical protein C8J56DRAFT_918034 [Mycena floridula]|nr:hypothetical protein C8J56DRAFT_918034 [Mycena floridula]